jgi:hypothetical protein
MVASVSGGSEIVLPPQPVTSIDATTRRKIGFSIKTIERPVVYRGIGISIRGYHLFGYATGIACTPAQLRFGYRLDGTLPTVRTGSSSYSAGITGSTT